MRKPNLTDHRIHRGNIEGPVICQYNGGRAQYRLKPAYNADGHEWKVYQTRVNADEDKKKIKVPRPPNRFILFRTNFQNMIKESEPSITNNDLCKLHLTSVDDDV